MEKRYQVFVSSTYADLVDERQHVIQTLMQMDCIPAGMELFPAADEEQFEFIKRVINDCDYYILIIGGRYGSVAPDGVSYTEMEYDYAIDRGLKVVAFLHEKPDEIPVAKSDTRPDLRGRLKAFRERVANGRLVKFWTKATDLPGLVALSLGQTIKLYPATGWVRADQIASAEAVTDLNKLLKRNQELETALAAALAEPDIPDLADLDEEVELRGTYRISAVGYAPKAWKACLTWAELFAKIAPLLIVGRNEGTVKEV